MIRLDHEFITDTQGSSTAAGPVQATSLGLNTPRFAQGDPRKSESDSDSRVINQRVAGQACSLTPLEKEFRKAAMIGRDRGFLRDMTEAEKEVRAAMPADQRDPIWVNHHGQLHEIINERTPESFQVRYNVSERKKR